MIPIKDLAPSITPRERAENSAHVHLLAELDGEVDPILVHRPTMRVIDGAHRVRAAMLRGRTEIAARFFEGSDEDAFVLAVQLNVGHGLPLTLNERRAAARRIVLSHPHWSDRAIAKRTGLNPKTVGRIRDQSDVETVAEGRRVGSDGKSRPVSSVEARRSAAALLLANPKISLREVSRKSGLSVGTVRDVRKRVDQGQDPVPERLRRQGGKGAVIPAAAVSALRSTGRVSQVSERTDAGNAGELVRKLARDPSLRATEAGRVLLRMLMVTEVDRDQWEEILRTIPGHCAPLVRSVVLQRAQHMRELAYMVEAEADGRD